MAKRPELMVMTGELAGKRFTVTSDGLRLGRSSSNDLHLADEELSRNHCMFEADGEAGIRVVDLASANGTFVNGVQLGMDAKELKVGDVIEVGASRLEVVSDAEPSAPADPAAGVDLGLGASGAGASAAAANAPRRPPLLNMILAAAAALAVAAIALVLMLPRGGSEGVGAVPAPDAPPALVSLRYEKVEADATRIFRYEMTIDDDGVLHVGYDDVPEANRHVDKSVRLDERAAKRIAGIFDTAGWSELDPAYSGPSASAENALKSARIRTVFGTRVREVLVENASEPEAFRAVREALETFANNELGIWATQYSKEQLLELSSGAAALADSKWEERDVEYGNLAAAVKSYREAVFYLETVSPKPEGYADLKARLETADQELEKRYKDQRFSADRAINLQDWETAAAELRILCQIVPDKNDERYAEANAKLVDVENRLAKAKKGGK